MLGTTKRSNGGWKGSPNSLAALVPTYFPNQLVPRCVRCRRAALRGTKLCVGHTPGASRFRGGDESRLLQRMDKRGLLPVELVASSAWRALDTVPCAVRAPVRLALVLAWARRDDHPLHWGQLWRSALNAARLARPGARSFSHA